MSTYYIVEKETKDVIAGPVVTNHSISFDDACKLAGLQYLTYEDDGVDTDGWYLDGILWDESVAELTADIKG